MRPFVHRSTSTLRLINYSQRGEWCERHIWKAKSNYNQSAAETHLHSPILFVCLHLERSGQKLSE